MAALLRGRWHWDDRGVEQRPEFGAAGTGGGYQGERGGLPGGGVRDVRAAYT